MVNSLNWIIRNTVYEQSGHIIGLIRMDFFFISSIYIPRSATIIEISFDKNLLGKNIPPFYWLVKNSSVQTYQLIILILKNTCTQDLTIHTWIFKVKILKIKFCFI